MWSLEKKNHKKLGSDVYYLKELYSPLKTAFGREVGNELESINKLSGYLKTPAYGTWSVSEL